MRILLVQPPAPIIERSPSLGIGYIGAVLSERGHTVRIIHAGKEKLGLNRLVSACMEFDPQLLGIQSFSFFHDMVVAFAARMKSVSPAVKIMVGGPHQAGIRGAIFSGAKHFDYAFSGEAEVGAVELAEAVAGGASAGLENISGLIWRSNGDARVNPVRQVENLDDIPFPLWEQLDPQNYPSTAVGFFAPALPVAPFITSRGCDKGCSFCQHVMKGLRMRSIENCMEELDLLWNSFSISAFALLDQNFAYSESRVIEFCEAISRTGRDYKWSCPNGIRLDSLTPFMISSMHKAGCRSVAVGIESISQGILKNMNKIIALEEITKGLSTIKEGKMKVTGNFIFGFPGETQDTIVNTIKFSLSAGIDRAHFSVFVPFPGTKFFKEFYSDSEVTSIKWSAFDVYSTGNAAITNPVRLRFYLAFAYFLFYIRPRILLESLRATPLRRYPHLLRRVMRIVMRI